MADIIGFCRNVLQYSYNTAAAVATFNHRIVSSLIQGTTECYQATATVLRGLGSALSDILYYIADFFLEALNLTVVCLRFLGKFAVLVYHILTSLAGGIVFALEWVGFGISQSLQACFSGLKTLSTHLAYAWESLGPSVSGLFTNIGQYLSSFGSHILEAATSVLLCILTPCMSGLNYAGEKLNDGAQYLGECAYDLSKNMWSNLCEVLSTYVAGLGSILEASMTPFCYTMKNLKDATSSLWEWLCSLNGLANIPAVVYIYILVATLLIIMFKIILGHMNRHGMTIPLFHFSTSRATHPARIRQRFLIDSSDEESMYEEDIYDNNEEDSDDGEDQEHFHHDDEEESDEDGDIHYRRFELEDDSDSEVLNSDGDSSDRDSDDLEVEEFEVQTDSDSDAESENPIQIELPDRNGGYNLRTRFSPIPSTSNSVLSPGDLEKVLESERDKRLCVVCQDQVKNVLVLPCRHMCLCVECAHEIAQQRTRTRRVCPLCRSRIETVMNVFI